MDLASLSKFLSYVLRHHPESIGLELDANGWAKLSELIHKAQQNGRSLDRDLLKKVMDHGSKQRFILSENGNYIRAGYGHSIEIDLQLKPKVPPGILYHGTAKKNVQSIFVEGIHSGSRNFVHLSATQNEARKVGNRHGPPAILSIQARRMSEQGSNFYQSESESEIWLTSHVPPEYVESAD